jgi:hypothetical protein
MICPIYSMIFPIYSMIFPVYSHMFPHIPIIYIYIYIYTYIYITHIFHDIPIYSIMFVDFKTPDTAPIWGRPTGRRSGLEMEDHPWLDGWRELREATVLRQLLLGTVSLWNS